MNKLLIAAAFVTLASASAFAESPNLDIQGNGMRQGQVETGSIAGGPERTFNATTDVGAPIFGATDASASTAGLGPDAIHARRTIYGND